MKLTTLLNIFVIVLMLNLNVNAKKTKTCECLDLGKCDAACKCLPGIVGLNCDQCAKGYFGIAPKCNKVCGDDFDFWNKKIESTKNSLVNSLNTKKKVEFKKQLKDINLQLNVIQKLLVGNEYTKLSSEENFEKILQRIEILDKQINVIEDLLFNLHNDIPDTKNKLKDINSKLKVYNQKLKRIKLDAKKLDETNAQAPLNKINVVLKKLKLIAQAVPENKTNACSEKLKNLQKDLDRLEEIKNNLTQINKTITSLSVPSIQQISNLTAQSEAKLKAKMKQVENVSQQLIAINMEAIINTCQNIFDITNDTLMSSLNLFDRTGHLMDDIKTALKQKHPNLKDFEDLTKQILANEIFLTVQEIEGLREMMIKVIESSDLNPFITEDIKRIEGDLKNIQNKTQVALSNTAELKKNAEMALMKLVEVQNSYKHTDERINNTLSIANKFDNAFAEFKQKVKDDAIVLEKMEEKIELLNSSLWVVDNVKEASFIAKTIKEDAIGLFEEYKEALKASEDHDFEYKKRREELAERTLSEAKIIRLDGLLLRASNLAQNFPKGSGYKKLKKEVEILTQRVNSYLIAIEKRAVEHNKC